MEYKYSKISGKIIRYIICAVTIDLINITESIILSYFVITPIINLLLDRMSYYTCRIIVYRKMGIDEPSFGSLGYTISYSIYVVITFIAIIILKNIGIIPFANDFDIKFIKCIVEYLNNRIMSFSNKIIETLITTTI